MINIKLDNKAVKTLQKVVGGGTVVVDELPKTGEEHIIYELQEKKVIQSIVVMSDQQMVEDHRSYENTDYFFAFDTTEEMQQTFNSITPDANYHGDIYLNYITNEDKLIGATYMLRIPSGGDWIFTEATKVSGCKFDISSIFVMEDPEYVVILKEYLGVPESEEEAWYTGRLWNDKLYTFEKRVSGVVLGTPTVGSMIRTECDENLEQLPPDTPIDEVFENIPYEKIINPQLPDNHWYFTPKTGEVTVTSYWIYSKGEWTNIDELPTVTLSVKTTFSDVVLEDFTLTCGGVELPIVHYATRESSPMEEAIYHYEFGYVVVPTPTNDNYQYNITLTYTGSYYGPFGVLNIDENGEITTTSFDNGIGDRQVSLNIAGLTELAIVYTGEM